MISRVAEVCFWLYRHVERADAMARLLRVNRGFVLDAPLDPLRKWYPLLVVSGEHERFSEAYPEEARADGELVQEYLTWNLDNPVAVASATYWARENAATIRNVVSLEMWEVLNEHWHWLRGGAGRRLYQRDREGFYRRISQSASMVQGIAQNTMLHETPFDFMRLGLLLERAAQTARVLDMHHHTFEQEGAEEDSALASMQWLALLRSCSGSGPFLRRTRRTPTGPGVAAFLVLDGEFPRSVLHCLTRARGLLARVRTNPERGEASWEALCALEESIRELSGDELAERGLHAELTRVVSQTADICDAIHSDYFDPAPAPPSTAAKETSNA